MILQVAAFGPKRWYRPRAPSGAAYRAPPLASAGLAVVLTGTRPGGWAVILIPAGKPTARCMGLETHGPGRLHSQPCAASRRPSPPRGRRLAALIRPLIRLSQVIKCGSQRPRHDRPGTE